MSKLTGFLVPARGKAYFFYGKEYVRYDVTARKVDAGYPKPIAENWKGAFVEDIDAAIVRPAGDYAYFFRGSQYVKIDLRDNAVLDGYPKPISGNWHGLFEKDIDAALPALDGVHAYFFRGAEYVKYDLQANQVVSGYPKRIAENWHGMFDADIDTAVAWPDGHAYFFRGGDYVKHDMRTNTAVSGHPKPIEGNWSGLPGRGYAAATRVTGTGARPVAVESPGGGRITDKSDPAPADLVKVDGHGKKVELHHLAAEHWQLMVDAARADGIADPLLLPTSGYRSAAYQKGLFDKAVARYGSEAAARKWVAPPGGSPHQSGRAIDFWMGVANDSKNVGAQRKTAVWAWLVANAERFGFYPYDAEPWHWEYNPPA